MAPSTRSPRPRPREDTPSAPSPEALGEPASIPRGGFRARARAKPGVREAYRLGVFVAGLLFIVLGVGLMAFPGPLTIPPVLVGLWIWSTEFRFAERFFDSFRQKADDAWEHAKAHPVSSAAITGGGLIGAALAFWAASHYGLIEKGKDALL